MFFYILLASSPPMPPLTRSPILLPHQAPFTKDQQALQITPLINQTYANLLIQYRYDLKSISNTSKLKQTLALTLITTVYIIKGFVAWLLRCLLP